MCLNLVQSKAVQGALARQRLTMRLLPTPLRPHGMNAHPNANPSIRLEICKAPTNKISRPRPDGAGVESNESIHQMKKKNDTQTNTYDRGPEIATQICLGPEISIIGSYHWEL